MRSDDDGFVSRQVAASTLLRNTSLSTPVPYRTEVFDVSKFASVQFSFSPTAGSVFPLYITVEWWIDRNMSIRLATDVLSWDVVGDTNSRRWSGAIPCRSDFMSVTLDSAGAATTSVVIVGSSRVVTTITQQTNSQGAAGTPPFALAFNDQVVPAGPSNGANIFVPPWFGEIEISVQTNCTSSVATYLLVYGLGASNVGSVRDAGMIPLELNVGGCFASLLGTLRWNTKRFAVNGQALRLLPGNGGAPAGDFLTTVQPVTGRG